MVLGILTAIAACPAIIGTTEAVRQGQHKNAKEKHRGVKSNLVVTCTSRSSRATSEINGGTVVLRDKKVRLTLPKVVLGTELYVQLFIAVAPASAEDTSAQEKSYEHPFAGYFLPFPDQNWGRMGEGFVSTISDDPPQLNWIYVDQDTYEIKYGNRVEAEPHHVGPWDCTRIDRRVTLEGWEYVFRMIGGDIAHRLSCLCLKTCH